MKVIPVVDLMGGIVVHARAGNRDDYRPLQSLLTDSCRPREVAAALLRVTGGRTLYLADLDAIRGGEPSWPVYKELIVDGLELWLDAGVRFARDVDRLLEAGVAKAVVGSETLAGIDDLGGMVERWGAGRVVFSLDLKGGRSLAPEAWGEPIAIAESVIGYGVREMIVLDLARVGTGEGTGTEELCRELRRRHPELMLYVGGGVRTRDDLTRFEGIGMSGALAATALHQRELLSS